MLKRFCVEGYRGFREKLISDLSHPRDYQFNSDASKDGIVKDSLVYRRNGMEKTNLARAILGAPAHCHVTRIPIQANCQPRRK